MNEDVYLFDEFTAVTKLFEKAQVEYIRPGWSETTASNDYPSRRVARNLRWKATEERCICSITGLPAICPRVYRLNENGEIIPYRLYVPLSESTGRSRSPLDKPLRLSSASHNEVTAPIVVS